MTECVRFIKKHLPRRLVLHLGYYHAILHFILHGQAKQLPHKIRKKRGKGKEIYYVHQVSSATLGILAVYRSVLPRVAKKMSKGYKVIIDYEDPANADMRTIGIDNMWEDTFEQPCGEQAANINLKDNVIIEGNIADFSEVPSITQWRDREYYRKWKRLSEKVLPMRKELREEFDLYFKDKFNEKRILGVALREYFRAMKELNSGWSGTHPNQPSIDEYIEIVSAKMREFKCEYVYITTEYQDTIQKFEKVFPGKLLFIERDRKSHICEEEKRFILEVQSEKRVTDAYVKRARKLYGEDRKEIQNNYVKEIYGLSKCNALLGAASGGMAVALIWNGGEYEDVFLLDEGNIKGFAY